jgi:hypothetical protein
MEDFSSNRFADVYICSVLEILRNNNPLSAENFYNYIFSDVSKKTGFSEDEIKYLHHAFHWSLFLEENHPLEIFPCEPRNEEYLVRLKDGKPEKSKLVENVLEKHKVWLEKRMERISNLKKTSN